MKEICRFVIIYMFLIGVCNGYCHIAESFGFDDGASTITGIIAMFLVLPVAFRIRLDD
jgi:hypothetical protein